MKLLILYVLAFLAFFSLVAWWETYKFADCKHVGHTTLYCIGNIAK